MPDAGNEPKTRMTQLIGAKFPDGIWKWCGGVLGGDGKVYCVPYYAKQVLCIDPITRTTELIGDVLPGGFKWCGGVLGGDGKVYCVPCHAKQVLCIDPETRTTELIGDEFPGGFKWCGGVLGADGKVYCVPCHAKQVLCIDPETRTTELIGDELPGVCKWDGGVLGRDGKVYCVPCYAEQVLCIDPETRTTELIGDELPGVNKWDGGVLGGDGKVYCVPCYAEQVLCIDPETRKTELIGDELPFGWCKWVGGVLGGDDKVYCVPFDATQVLCIDPETRTTELIGDEFPGGGNKWSGGVLGGDGKVYCVPCHAKQVLCIDPETRTTERIGDELPGGNKWQGGVLGGDGKVYCVPHHAEQVLCITTPSAAPCPTESDDAPTGQAPLKAFVLGLKNYSWSTPLTCTVNDAVDMATKLHDLGAQVMLLTDDISDTEERRKLAKRLAGGDGCGDNSQEKVNGNVIDDRIAEWMQTLKEGDVAIFFCSCHGEEYDGRSYILPSSDEPYEKDPEAHAKALKKDAIDAEATLNEILQPKLRTHRRFRSSKGQAPAVVINLNDSCRWRHVIEGGKTGGRGLRRGMNVGTVPRSLVGHACASGTLANDDETKERNSPYTKALLDHLGTTDDVRNDLEAVREAVRIKTASLKIAQTPTMSSSLGLRCPHPLLCLKRSRASSSMDGSDHAGTAESSSGKRKAQKQG